MCAYFYVQIYHERNSHRWYKTLNVTIKDMQNSDTLTFKVDLKSDETITGITIAAVYDNDGKFIAVKQYDAASEVSFTFSDVKNVATVKVFWWDGIGSMIPQAKNETVSL